MHPRQARTRTFRLFAGQPASRPLVLEGRGRLPDTGRADDFTQRQSYPQPGQRREQFLAIAGQDHQTRGIFHPTELQRIADLLQHQLRCVAQVLPQLPAEGCQKRRGWRAEGKNQYVRRGARGNRHRPGIFLDQDVRVVAARAIGVQTRQARRLPRRPGDRLLGDPTGLPGGLQVFVGLAKVQYLVDPVGLQAADDLEDRPQCGGRVHMPGHGLEGTDQALPLRQLDTLLAPQLQQRMVQRIPLGDIGDRIAHALGFDIVELTRIDSRPAITRLNQLRMRGHTGRGDGSAAPAVVIDRAVADQRIDAVTVGPGPGQGLEQQAADPLGAKKSVRVGAERTDRGLWAHLPALRQLDKHIGAQQQVAGADDRRIDLPAAQGANRMVDGHGTAGAHGVDPFAGATQIVEMRDPVGQHTVRLVEAVTGIHPGLQQVQVILVALGGNKDPGATALPVRVGVTGIFKCLAYRHQQQALLRVHQHRLFGRKAEEPRVELVDRRDEPAPARAHPAFLDLRPRVMPGVVEATQGDLFDQPAVIVQRLPERLGADRLGEGAGQADNCYRLQCRGDSGRGVAWVGLQRCLDGRFDTGLLAFDIQDTCSARNEDTNCSR